jgi:adenylosuccinate lyase
MIKSRLCAELPFMATEDILMAGVAAGGDRQDLHERIRRHAQAAARRLKYVGRENDLLERIAADLAFAKVKLRVVTNPKQFVGRAPQQVDEFLKNHVSPVRRRYRGALNRPSDLQV